MHVLKRIITRQWRGEMGFWVSLVGPLWLGYGVWTFVARHFAEGALLAQLVLVLVLMPLALWQCVGMFRATERQIAEFRNPLIYVVGFGSIAIVLLGYIWSLVVFGVGLPKPPEIVPRHKIEHISNAKLVGDHYIIEGEITLETYYVLNRMLLAGQVITHIDVSSLGGSVPAGRGLARLILEHDMNTHASDRCFSACTIVFLAGKNRTMSADGQLGFHQYGKDHMGDYDYPVFLDPVKEQEKDKTFFEKRGVSSAFLARIFDAPNTDIWVPTRAELQEAGIVDQ